MRSAALDSQQDYGVRKLTEAICGGLPSKAYADEYLALYYFVLSRTRYMRDPRTIELVRSPHVVAGTLWSGSTPSLDCDDMAALLAAMILAVGGQCRFVTVAFSNMHVRGERQYSHVFVQAREPQTGAWITLDPVAADKTKSMLRRVRAAKVWPVA
jgi:transglutaminase-like putative cysteine protease